MEVSQDVEKQEIGFLESTKPREVLSTNDAELDPEAERRCVNGISRHMHQLMFFAFRLVRSIDMRIVPASMTIYLLCSLDRSNVVSSPFSPYPAPPILRICL